jgi:hypothetical protein
MDTPDLFVETGGSHFLPGLTSSYHAPHLYLPCFWDYRYEPPHLALYLLAEKYFFAERSLGHLNCFSPERKTSFPFWFI